MKFSPRRMQMQYGLNMVNASSYNRQSASTVNNLPPSPAPAKKRSPRDSYRRKRVMAKQHSKRQARPIFDAALCEPPQAVLNARAAFAEAIQNRNPRPPAPAAKRPAEIIYLDTGFPGSSPVGTPQPDGGIAQTPGEPVPEPSTAALLAERMEKADSKKAATARLEGVRKYRTLRAATKKNAVEAFAKALDTARAETRRRLSREGTSRPEAVHDTAKKLFIEVEAKASMEARKLLENYTGKPLDLYAAGSHKAALDSFLVGVKGIHADYNAPADFGSAPEAFGNCFELAYFGILAKNFKRVEIVGGPQDGNVFDIKIAAMLRSYETLLPALDDDD